MRHVLHRLLALALLAALPLATAAADPGHLVFGMNLAPFTDYGSEYPTIDLMKSARTWFSHNAQWKSGAANAWDTGLAGKFPTDADGWPSGDLPMELPSTEGPQVLSTVWANAQALEKGRWVCTWNGQAEVALDMGAKVTEAHPGRLVFEVDPKAGLLRLTIVKNSASDPIHDLKVIPERWVGQNSPWNPVWVDKLKPFHTLRFMDWGATNGSPHQKWEDRTSPGHYTWTGTSGAPYEAMIDLANELGDDLWVCIPHLADETYLRSMARLFRSRLKPGIKLYIEYSNETWNWIFAQAHWLKDNGPQSVAWPERIVPSIQKALDVWSDEWKGASQPLVRVVGIQTGWFDVAQRVARNLRPGSFDALAGTFYLGLSQKSTKKLAELGAQARAQDVWALARKDMAETVFPWVQQVSSLADELKVRLVFYEGGQHLTPDPFGSVQAYNPALEQAQRGRGIYDLYRDWFALLRTLPQAKTPEGLLALHFNLAAPLSGRYGSWGALESIDAQPPYLESAPKYQALLDD
jgi:hypothetical protein